MAASIVQSAIQSTAGAVSMKTAKGQVYMQKVKVTRYVTGKRPDYAPDYSSGSEDEDFLQNQHQVKTSNADNEIMAAEPLPLPEQIHITAADERRLKRLEEASRSSWKTVDDDKEEDEEMDQAARIRRRRLHQPEVIVDRDAVEGARSSSEEEDDVDDDEFEKRRKLLREKALKQQDEELLQLEEEHSEEEEQEESEYSEYTDSEEEEPSGPRLKPVFVRKRDRVTIHEREREAAKARQQELEERKFAEERKQQSRKLVENIIKTEQDDQRRLEKEQLNSNLPGAVTTSGILLGKAILEIDGGKSDSSDSDEEEAAYESWKLRELRRIKRDRDEREQIQREREEIERLHGLTEEERKLESKNNPKVVTNQQPKGKMKFLQKYFHRGVFYLNEESDVFRRDFAQPTLEDHYDKTILPKVMQVKNFGRSGRTKYTHLVDQDTTSFDSPWSADSVQNLKFTEAKGAAMKQVFSRPSRKKD